ncbi:Triose-phosphate Transporter [Mortierella sp. AD010]|nr:Triose-phosphate Transporter [Mortierella sp. AD010]
MTDSFGGPSRAVQFEDGSEEHGAPSLNVSDTQNSRQGHYRTESISSTESHSSDDGIEWENPGYSSEYASDDDNDGYRSDEEDEYEESDGEYEQQDTQRLLSSSNARIGGLGMGMRVGETGTGTTIGLDLEQDTRQNGEDYDALPLTSVDQRSRRYPNRRETRPKRSGRKDGRRSTQTFMPSMIRLGDLQTEQEKLIAKRQLRIKMFWNVFYVFAWTKIMPCAVASGLDVGLSNNSLKSITLAFYTMCKSSSLAFVLLFAFAFKLERPTWTLAGVIGVICIGLFMMVMSEVDFVLVGFIQVMLASVLGGLRWSLTQLLLERTDTKSGSLANPISTIFFLSPIMGICLCIVAGLFEGYGNIFSSEFFQSAGSTLGTLGLLFLGGVFAFAMVLAEFNLIARTSVVSLSVLGIIKEVVTIVISSFVFHDQLTIVNILGLFITLSGIGFYHFMKLRELKAKARKTAMEIAELHLATSTNHIDGSVDRMRAYETRRKRRSHKSRPVYQGIREGTLGNDFSAERSESTIDELPRHTTIRSDGSDPPNKDDPLMLSLDSASPTAPHIGL